MYAGSPRRRSAPCVGDGVGPSARAPPWRVWGRGTRRPASVRLGARQDTLALADARTVPSIPEGLCPSPIRGPEKREGEPIVKTGSPSGSLSCCLRRRVVREARSPTRCETSGTGSSVPADGRGGVLSASAKALVLAAGTPKQSSDAEASSAAVSGSSPSARRPGVTRRGALPEKHRTVRTFIQEAARRRGRREAGRSDRAPVVAFRPETGEVPVLNGRRSQGGPGSPPRSTSASVRTRLYGVRRTGAPRSARTGRGGCRGVRCRGSRAARTLVRERDLIAARKTPCSLENSVASRNAPRRASAWRRCRSGAVSSTGSN